jgi:hypothetical protein
VFLLGPYTAREPCTVIGIPVKAQKFLTRKSSGGHQAKRRKEENTRVVMKSFLENSD